MGVKKHDAQRYRCCRIYLCIKCLILVNTYMLNLVARAMRRRVRGVPVEMLCLSSTKQELRMRDSLHAVDTQ